MRIKLKNLAVEMNRGLAAINKTKKGRIQHSPFFVAVISRLRYHRK